MGDRVAVIKQGRCSSRSTRPQTLYDRPDEPVRRRLHRLAGDEPGRGRSRPRGRRPVRHVRTTSRSGSTTPCRPTVRASERYEGRRVIIGIRPENMEDASIMPVDPGGPADQGRHRPPRGARLGGAGPLHRRCSARPDGRHEGVGGRTERSHGACQRRGPRTGEGGGDRDLDVRRAARPADEGGRASRRSSSRSTPRASTSSTPARGSASTTSRESPFPSPERGRLAPASRLEDSGSGSILCLPAPDLTRAGAGLG